MDDKTKRDFELIKTTQNEDGEIIVSGRELHEFLEVKTPYTQWFERMVGYGFVENSDFVLVLQKCETNNPKNPFTTIIDHALKLDMAKELSMLQRNEKGKQARQYFIEVEKYWNNPDMIIKRAHEILERKVARLATQNLMLEQQVEEQKPKVLFADSVSASKTTILVGELAKLLKQNGVQIGQKRLFEWLREKGYLIKRKGTDYNMPTQYSMELCLFEIKETSVTHSDGHISVNKTPKVTGKGQLYFIEKFLSKKDGDTQ